MKLSKTKIVVFMMVVLIGALSISCSKGSDVKRNIMYYADWSIWGGQGNYNPQDMPSHMYTHINYAFLDIDKEGNLVWLDRGAAAEAGLAQPGVGWGDVNAGILPAFRALRAKNPNVKIGVSLGGWSRSGDFSVMAANEEARANLVNNIVKFVEYTGMDFVDVDWEYPAYVRQPDLVDNKSDEGTPDSTPADKENYIKLMQEIRKGLDGLGKKIGKYYELSVAIQNNQESIEQGIDIKKLFKIIDFANLMTYDARGAFDETSGHHTSLYGNPADPQYEKGYSADQLVQYLLDQGVPKNKLVVGVAFYTRGWQQVDNVEVVEGLPGLFAPAHAISEDADGSPSRGAKNDWPITLGDGGRNMGVWARRNFTQLYEEYPNLKEYWDDTAKAAYLYDGSTFITLDNERSIAEKTKYVLENDLGGIITWMASQDAVTDTELQRDELNKAIFEGLYAGEPLPALEIIEGDLDISVNVEADGSAYNITISNNEAMDEMDSVLSVVEKQRETIMLPKLYIDNGGIALVSSDLGSAVTTEGEYTVVDLLESSKYISPGQTINIKLEYADGSAADVKNLSSIKITQRVSTAATEMSEQVIYGK